MKKELINEILRIKVLSNYDSKNTFTENENIISERYGSEYIKDAEVLAKDAKFLKGLESELPGIISKIGSLGPKGSLKTAEDIIFALKTSSLSAADLGKLNFGVMRNSKNPSLRKTASEFIVSQKTFSKNFSSGTAASRLQKLKDLNPNLSDDIIKDLHIANELRIKKTPKPITKPTDDLIGGGKNIDRAVDANRVSQNVTVNIGTPVGGEQFIKTYGKDFDDFARTNGHSNMNDWMKTDPDGAYLAIKNNKTKGIFGKIINWGKRRIKRKVLWGLAKIAGISVGVWWLFFKNDGFTIEDEDGGDGGDGKTDDGKVKIGGGEITDNEGNKYKECENTYYKGCVNKKGNTDIQKAQDCLGVTPNGFFNQETEDALMKKINKKSFSLSDLDDICAKSYGGGSFSA